MNADNTVDLKTAIIKSALTIRQVSVGDQPTILTDIYEENVNMATWKRELPKVLQSSISDFLTVTPDFKLSMTTSPNTVLSSLTD